MLTDDQIDTDVQTLIGMAETHRDEFDAAVLTYVTAATDREPVFRDPALAEWTLDALDRLIHDARANPRPTAAARRLHGLLVAERKAVKPIAGAQRAARNREALTDSPRNRAARALAKQRCAGCGTPLAAQYLALVRQEERR